MLSFSKTKANVSKKVKMMWSTMTVEPVVAMYCMITALSYITGEELYLKKACSVNLNYTMEICENIYDHQEVQIETQELVSGIQSSSAILQGIPRLVFTLLAGPLTDTYGRKLFIIIPLLGHVIINIVYLVNSVWFHQLKVEFLLFECLEDITGGSLVFFLAVQCFIVDITTEENRTARMSIAEAFYGLGWLIGLPLGVYTKKHLGYVPLFTLNLILALGTILYVAVFIKDSYHLLSVEQKEAFDAERDTNPLRCDIGIFKNISDLTIGSFKTVFKKRQNKDRIWIILWILIFSISTIVNAGFDIVGFMFYRFQYKISTEVYGHLSSTFFLSGFLSQLFVVPFLCNYLKLRDTTILVLALVPASLGFLGEAFFSQVWILFVIWSVFYLLYFSISATARSAVSKFMDPTEIGKAFSVLGVLESCLGLMAKPAYGFIYRSSLNIFAGLWCFVSIGWLAIALGIAIGLHFGIKTVEERNIQELGMGKM